MIFFVIYLVGVSIGVAFTGWLVWRDASWDRLAALSVFLIGITWPISIPYLFGRRVIDWFRSRF